MLKIYLAKDLGWPGGDDRLVIFEEHDPLTGAGHGQFAKDILKNLYTDDVHAALMKQLSEVKKTRG